MRNISFLIFGLFTTLMSVFFYFSFFSLFNTVVESALACSHNPCDVWLVFNSSTLQSQQCYRVNAVMKANCRCLFLSRLANGICYFHKFEIWWF